MSWGNSAAHEFELQALVAPRRRKIFAISFLGSEYFAQRFNRPFDNNGQKKLGRVFWPPCHTFGDILGLYTSSLLRNQISAKNYWGGVLNLFLSKDHKTTLTYCQVIIVLYTSSRLTKSSTLLSTPVLASRIYTSPQSLKTY